VSYVSRMAVVLPWVMATAGSLLVATSATAAGKAGDVMQTDALGMNVLTYQYNPGPTKTTTVADAAVLSEFVGAHDYVIDRVRLGMNLQFSEQLSPAPGSTDGSRFRTFALLPQIGWDFWGPMFAAFVVTVAPWSSGTSAFGFGFQGLLGVGFPIGDRIKLTAAAEVPFNFVPSRTVGLTPLLGVSIRL
jgi:hypothetical protein